jgi:hypothetical protein
VWRRFSTPFLILVIVAVIAVLTLIDRVISHLLFSEP